MAKKSNSFKNIIIVLLALLLLGIAAGPASAAITYSGAGDIVGIGMTGNDVSNITFNMSGTHEIGANTSVNITLMNPAVTFDTSATPAFVVVVGDSVINLTKNTATELGFYVTVDHTDVNDSLNLTGIKLNVASGISDGTVVFFNFSTNVTNNASNSSAISVTAKNPTPAVSGSNNSLYVDMDGEVRLAVDNLTLTSSVVDDDIGVGTSINITMVDSNVTFDTTATPTFIQATGSGTTITRSKNTATELGFVVSGNDSDPGDVFNLTGIKVNISAGAPTGAANYTVKTTPKGGSLVTQNAHLNVVREQPNAVTITHNGAGNSLLAGSNVVLSAHASSTNVTNYGGWAVNFTILTAPTPLTWTSNGLNSSFSNTSLLQTILVTTDSNGYANTSLKLSTRASADVGGTKTDAKAKLNGTEVNATLGGNAITTLASYEHHVNVTSDYDSAIGNGVERIMFTAELRDLYDNSVLNGSNKSGVVGVGLSGSAIPPAALPTAFENGILSFNATDSTKESVTATVDPATIGISTGSKIVTFVTDASGLRLTANRSSVPADNGVSAIRVYAQLLDASGNPLALHKDTNTWSYSQSSFRFGSGSNFSQVNATGVNTVDLLSGQYSGSTNVSVWYTNNTGQVLRGDISLATTQSIVVANSASSKGADPIKADQNSTLTATILDANNQPIENAEVTFKIEGGNGTITNIANTLQNATGLNQTLVVLTNSSGGAGVLFYNRIATETDIVNITVLENNVRTKIGSAPYSIAVNPANASTIVLTPVSQGITNINGSTANISVSLKDAYGNTVSDPLVLNVTNLNPALGDLSTAATGQLTLNGTGRGMVTFTVDSAPLEASSNIQFDALRTYNTAYLTTNITGFIASVTTSGPTGVIVTFTSASPAVGAAVNALAQLTDTAGNALSIPDKVLTFTVVKSGASVPIAVNVSSTNSSGIATYNLTPVITEAGTYTVTASNSTLGLSNSSSIVFAGPIASLAATANNTAGSFSTPVNSIVTINATAKDSLGNVAIGATGTVTFLVNGSSIGSAALTNGVASITYTKSVAGTYNVMAFINATLNNEVSVTFTPVAPLPVLSVSANPATIVNGTATNVTFTVTPAVSGVLVTLSGNATGNGTTDASGVVVISVNATGAGSVIATASKTGYTSGTTTVTAGPSVPETLSVSASPANVTVGTPTNVTFTVTPAVSGVLVTLSGAGVSMNGTTTNGTVTIADVNATSSGAITVTASKTGYTGGTTTVTAVPLVPVTLAVSANPSIVTVGTATNVTFTVTGAGMAVIGGATVTLSGNAAGSGSTDTSGIAVISVNATGAGLITATASKGGYTDGTTTLTANLPGQQLTTLTVSNATVAPGNTTIFTAVARDQNGAVMTGVTVTWSSSNTSVGTIGASTGVFTAILDGTTTITATSSGVTGTATATVSSGAFPDPILNQYDTNHDGHISKAEAITAVVDYFASRITKQDAIKVVVQYFQG